jgi:hypothetical protein
MSSSNEEIIYIDEEIPEIEYYELLSIEDLIKINPNFIAFSREDIYIELFNFVKSKTKTENFLKLFYEVVNKKTNVNNFIIVADSIRGDFEEEDIISFIAQLKKYDKMADINLALKSKNKLWFPLKYDIDNDKIRFNASQKTIIELSENNKYIVFKEDETNIPIMAVYFYSPITVLEDYLNDKIMSHLQEPLKLDIMNADNYETFEDLIKDYKIPLTIPLKNLDENDYNYSTLKLLLQKYNYDFDNLSMENLNEIKLHLDKLHNEEKTEIIKYRNVEIKNVVIHNPRYTFFNILKEIKTLVDLTLKSADIIKNQLKDFEGQRTKLKDETFKSLYSIIDDLNDKNYTKIIDDIRDLRKNMTLNISIAKLNEFASNNKKSIIDQLDELEIRFELLKYTYNDIYKLNFSCNDDEHEIHIGTDETKYEGIPTKIGRIDENEENITYINDNDEKDEEDEINNENKLIKYYKNQTYNNENGFAELLRMLLPFIYKMEVISGLPLNYDLLVSLLFNKFRTFESKSLIIKKHIPNIDDEDLEIYLKRPIKYILLGEDIEKDKDVNKKYIKDAIEEYFANFKNVMYEVIAYWSVKIQMAIVNNTLFLDYSKISPVCDHLWEEYGVPYDMTSKTGVTIYLNCIFMQVFDDSFKTDMMDIVKITDDYKKIIIDKINDNYNNELELMRKITAKKVKTNEGIKYYETLYDLLKKKEYKGDTFLKAYINALIYMPTINAKKIHKYLQGCCLERIDNNFSADLYLKTDRRDLKKAKDKLTGKRVFNMPRYKRFFIKKKVVVEKVNDFNKIDNPITYDIISIDLNKWLSQLKPNETIFTKPLIDNLLLSVFKATENYKDSYITYFNNKDLKTVLNNYDFSNYRQLGIGISKILYKYLKDDSFDFIKKINNTLAELDKLNSIINDDNINDIINIRRIAVIRMMSLPSSPENVSNKKYVPSININNYPDILKEIITSILNIINNSRMLNVEEQIDFINKIRENNKFDILAKLNKKTRDEIDIEKEMKKYGIKYEDDINDDDDMPAAPLEINKDKTDEDYENEGEEDFELDMEDGEDDDEYMATYNYGFIYAD